MSGQLCRASTNLIWPRFGLWGFHRGTGKFGDISFWASPTFSLQPPTGGGDKGTAISFPQTPLLLLLSGPGGLETGRGGGTTRKATGLSSHWVLFQHGGARGPGPPGKTGFATAFGVDIHRNFHFPTLLPLLIGPFQLRSRRGTRRAATIIFF